MAGEMLRVELAMQSCYRANERGNLNPSCQMISSS